MNYSIAEDHQKILKIALSSRSEDPQVVATDKHTLQELESLKEAILVSKDYSLKGDLLSNVVNFASDVVGESIEKKDLKEFIRGDACSNKWVGHASTGEEGTGIIIKAFPFSDDRVCNFLRELSGSELLNSLGLKRARVVQTLGVGKSLFNESGFMFLAESFAEGESILDIVRSIILGEDKLEKAKRAVRKVGLALGELHSTGSGKIGVLPRYRLERICMNYAVNQNRASASVTELDWLKMAQHYEKTLEQAEAFEYAYGYHHGEAHMESFLYNESTEKLTIIDVPQVHFAVDNMGEPMGVPAYDFVRFEEHLSSLRGEGLREGTFTLLKESFRKGYSSIAKSLPDKELRALFVLGLRMWGLGTYFDWEQTEDPQEKSYNAFMFQTSLEYFKGILT